MISCKYTGAEPWIHLNTIVNSLNLIRDFMGSQWGSCRIGDIGSNFLFLVISLPAEFWIYCILLKSVSGISYNRPLLLSEWQVINAWTSLYFFYILILYCINGIGTGGIMLYSRGGSRNLRKGGHNVLFFSDRRQPRNSRKSQKSW